MNSLHRVGSVLLLFSGIALTILYSINRLPDEKTTELYAPHFTCLAGDVRVIDVISTGDTETYVAYALLGTLFLFLFFAFSFLDWEYRFFLLLTGLFVWSCGLGHYFDKVTMYDSMYYYKAITCAVTGKISLAVAVYGLVLTPMIFRSARRLRALIKKL